MNQAQKIQRPVSGFFLALTTVMMWGSLPIAVQQVLHGMSVQTIVWYRFLVASSGLFLFLLVRKDLPKIKGLPWQNWRFLFLGVFGLAGNFYLFNYALKYIPPTTSQILSPVSGFLMLLSGVFLFREKLLKSQKIGLGLLILGLGLFFNQHWGDFFQFNLYIRGVLLGFCASLVWVCYGVSQKMLLLHFKPQHVLFLIYTLCGVFFTPTAIPNQIFNLNTLGLACLGFACANTLIAYGCYAEALNRWEVAKVSAVVTQIPIFTMIFSSLLNWLYPHLVQVEDLNFLSYLGASIVVLGALFSVIGHKFTNKDLL